MVSLAPATGRGHLLQHLHEPQEPSISCSLQIHLKGRDKKGGLLQEQFNSQITCKPIHLYVDTSGLPTATGTTAAGIEGQCTQVFMIYRFSHLNNEF